jgi:hypothetical protein
MNEWLKSGMLTKILNSIKLFSSELVKYNATTRQHNQRSFLSDRQYVGRRAADQTYSTESVTSAPIRRLLCISATEILSTVTHYCTACIVIDVDA